MVCKHLILGTPFFTHPVPALLHCEQFPCSLEKSFRTNSLRLNAIQNVGQLVALPFCALACDKFGRRATLLFGASVMLVGTILQGAAQNSQWVSIQFKAID